MKEFIAGALSGIAQTFIGHPFDTIKVNIQNKLPIKHLNCKYYFRGLSYPIFSAALVNATAFGVYNKAYKQTNSYLLSGFIAGIATTPIAYLTDVGKTRRQVGYTIKLSDFIKTKGLLSTFARETTGFASYFYSYYTMKSYGYGTLLSGAISGAVNWTIGYPIDVVRNRQLAQNISIMEAFKQGNIWSGYSVCIVRAILVNSVAFWVYEKCMESEET